MAKKTRGRPPRGEYPEKTAVMNFRIRPDTKRLLQAAAEASGRTLSQETEHQLRRALVDMGAGPTFAVMNVIGRAIDAMLVQRRHAKSLWTDDPYLFERVAKAISGGLEVFRPPGPITKPLDEIDAERVVSKFEGQAAVLQMLELVRSVDLSVPISKQSPQHRALRMMKRDLGALADRPATLTTNQIIEAGLREHQSRKALIDKARTNPEAITPDEALELWRLAAEMAGTGQLASKEEVS